MSKKYEINTDKVISSYMEKNMTMKEIASQYGCHRSVIARILSMAYKNKLSDNPVETCPDMGRVSVLKCSDANTSGSSSYWKMMV